MEDSGDSESFLPETSEESEFWSVEETLSLDEEPEDFFVLYPFREPSSLR